ncbi:hypothetical protein EG346_03750 [Chryseobacterium carnipullorum]|uniref:Uncharacterized protein n=1 Tax=Chryseobacterium carnipullorum TaxID=1124835 RepID=A0A376EJU4_CHRCU|nr:hypothetical protein [Chryseobacterium carnipullorum]AZA47351.1 hypothetical protein EG346_03750 [Chryseobacterium carnipullorum]AZA66694.1 hypothetical protein EG345_19865 [Chryseobacterium carnipullorum]STD09612.1 Uncharacterised protein [Chryseobacterium carnipullorum]
MENNNYTQEAFAETEIKDGDKLRNLVYRKNIERLEPVHHDVGIMFIYQASAGILSELEDKTKTRPYLDGYKLDISTIESLYNTYGQSGIGLQFKFVFLTKQEYIKYTGDNSVLESSDIPNVFLYIVATPLDNIGNPIKEHFVLFNLNYPFDITKIILNDTDYSNLCTNYLVNSLYHIMSAYSYPKNGSVCLKYTWNNVKEIMNEQNSDGEKYQQVEFILGEVTRYKILSDFFRRNPDYGLKEAEYKQAYSEHERQITVVGKYLPEEIDGKEGFFDMGSLYP